MSRALIASLLLCFALRARAEPCTGSDTELGLHVEGDPALAREIERQLAASLASRALSVCSAQAEAAVSVELLAGAQVQARIVVRDVVTQKRVERTLELTFLPADGRALAIAAAADELLRASWAELLLRDAPRPPEAPPALVSVARRSLPRRTPFELSIEVGTSLSSQRKAGLLALRVGSWFRPRWGASVRLLGGVGDRADAAHGSVRASELALALVGSYALTPIEARLGVSLELGSALALLWFSSRANERGLASDFARGAWLLDGRVRAWVGPTRLRGTLGAGVRWAARPARALDGSDVVTGNEGVAAELTVGLASLF